MGAECTQPIAVTEIASAMVKRKSKKQNTGKMDVDEEGASPLHPQPIADLQLATPAPDASTPVAMDSEGGCSSFHTRTVHKHVGN